MENESETLGTELNSTGFRVIGMKDHRIMVVPCPKTHTCILTEQQHLGQLHGGEIEETCKCGGFVNTVSKSVSSGYL